MVLCLPVKIKKSISEKHFYVSVLAFKLVIIEKLKCPKEHRRIHYR